MLIDVRAGLDVVGVFYGHRAASSPRRIGRSRSRGPRATRRRCSPACPRRTARSPTSESIRACPDARGHARAPVRAQRASRRLPPARGGEGGQSGHGEQAPVAPEDRGARAARVDRSRPASRTGRASFGRSRRLPAIAPRTTTGARGPSHGPTSWCATRRSIRPSASGSGETPSASRRRGPGSPLRTSRRWCAESAARSGRRSSERESSLPARCSGPRWLTLASVPTCWPSLPATPTHSSTGWPGPGTTSRPETSAPPSMPSCARTRPRGRLATASSCPKTPATSCAS